MSYIGRGIDQIDNISTLDNLSFSGSTATFNLTQNSVAFVPVSADALQIQIDGVIQSGNYTVSGSTVTFDFTPSGSSVCNGIRHFGVGLLTTVSDGAVTTAKLGSSAVTTAKINADAVDGTKIADDSISDEHLDNTAITGQTAITSLADTDKFLVSDASDSGNLKYVEKQYLPSGSLVFISGTTSASSVTNVVFDEVFSSTYKNYKIIGEYTAVDSSGDTSSRFKFRTGGSSGSDLTNSQYNYHFLVTPSDSNTVVNKRNTGDAVCEYTTEQDEDSENVGVRFDFTIFDPFASKRTTLSGQGRNTAQDGNCLPFTGTCDFKGVQSVTGIKFFVKTGNIKDIAIKIYGIVDS